MSWDFHEIQPNDIGIFSGFIKATEYPANLWSSNFPYLWAASQSKLRKVRWAMVDGMLAPFGHSYKGSLYLFCLPYGPGSPETVTRVILQCMRYCLEWNHGELDRTMVRMINHDQLGFLRRSPEFDVHFRPATLQGIERHLDVNRLVSLAGKDFADVRTKIHKFRRENPDAIIRPYEPSDLDPLVALGKRWAEYAGRRSRKIIDKTYYKEMLRRSDEFGQIVMVVSKGERIIGMVAGGILPNGQAWGSLLKYEAGFPGLSEFLSVEFAREIHRRDPGVDYLNIGSDLGPGGLRDYKLKFSPVLNLKRYQVYFKKSEN